MTELERSLLALGRDVAFPDAPELTARVRERIVSSRRMPRRALVVALATLALAIGVAFAVPPARSAILDLFGVGGVEIRRVETTPQFDRVTNRLLGVPTTLDQAARAVGFTLLVPDSEHVVLLERDLGAVTFAWSKRRLLLTEFAGEGTPFVQKSAGPGTRITHVLVNGRTGYWLEGEQHIVVFRDRRGEVFDQRAAGNVLVWEQDAITLRLEGAKSLEEALEIAGTLRRHAV